MGFRKSFVGFFPAMAVVIAAASAAFGQTATRSDVQIPKGTIALEGTPLVRIDATEDQVTRRELTQDEMTQHRLKIHVEKGQYFWASRGNVPLKLTSSGVRFRRVNYRITYVEHVDMAHGSVTYWGELRIVLGR